MRYLVIAPLAWLASGHLLWGLAALCRLVPLSTYRDRWCYVWASLMGPLMLLLVADSLRWKLKSRRADKRIRDRKSALSG